MNKTQLGEKTAKLIAEARGRQNKPFDATACLVFCFDPMSSADKALGIYEQEIGTLPEGFREKLIREFPSIEGRRRTYNDAREFSRILIATATGEKEADRDDCIRMLKYMRYSVNRAVILLGTLCEDLGILRGETLSQLCTIGYDFAHNVVRELLNELYPRNAGKNAEQQKGEKKKFVITAAKRDELVDNILRVVRDQFNSRSAEDTSVQEKSRVVLCMTVSGTPEIREYISVYERLFAGDPVPNFKNEFSTMMYCGNQADRIATVEKTKALASSFVMSMCGNPPADIGKLFVRKNGSITISKSQYIFCRVCVMLMKELPSELVAKLSTFSVLDFMECLKALAEIYAFGPYSVDDMPAKKEDAAPENDEETASSDEQESGSGFNESEYEAEILRLEESLRRSRQTISDFTEGFSDSLENAIRDDRMQFLAKLNSDSYNNILDMLMSLRSGLRKLRAEGRPVPYEINILPSLISQMLNFVRDCGMVPVLRSTGEVTELSAADVEKFNYSGSAFEDENDVKKVRILTSGWKSADSDTIVSLPKAEEIRDE